jgi:thiamine-phosphate pyrophosphorylase
VNDRRVARILDVNLNRLTEGLRVVEDVARLALEERRLLSAVRRLRTEVGVATRGLRRSVMPARQSEQDPGRGDRFDRTKRRSIEDVLFANLKRAEESCRVLEEMLKVAEPGLAPRFKEFRFRLYDVEAQAARLLDLPESGSILRPNVTTKRRRHAQR